MNGRKPDDPEDDPAPDPAQLDFSVLEIPILTEVVGIPVVTEVLEPPVPPPTETSLPPDDPEPDQPL